MPRKITMTQLDAKAQELGDVGKALAWAEANGYEVDTGTELPPVGQPQGALSAAMGGGPDEDVGSEEDDLGGLAGYDGAELDFTKLSDPKVFSQMYRQQRTAAQQQEQSAKQLFEQARARLAQRYAGPTRGDQMLALSQAMLAPRKVPGFKGFAGRMFGTFADISTAERQAAQQREDQLLALQQQYQTGAAARAAAQQKNTLDLMKTYGTLNKRPDMGTWSENLQRFIPKDKPVPIAVGKLPDGRRTEKMSDGSIRAYNTDGSVTMYDAAGNQIAQGAQ